MIQLAFYLGTKRENPQHAQLVDRAICWWTNSRFSHVEFVAAPAANGAPALTWAASNRDGEVRSTRLDIDNGRWEVVTVPGDGYQRLLAHFQAREGEPYGRLCAAAHAVPRPLRAALRWLGNWHPYCSNIVAEGMGLGEIWVHPQRLYEIVQTLGAT